MAGLNEVKLIGYLGRDPELRYTQSQTPVASLNVATTRKYRDRNDELQEETEWHRVAVWGKSAENCNAHLRKGSMVYIGGRLKTRSWEEQDGTKRYATEIVAEHVQFLDRKSGDGRPHPPDVGDEREGQRTARGTEAGRRSPEPPSDHVPGPGDDDIPF